MKTRSDIATYLKDNYPNDMDKILLADGFDNAFIGVENYEPKKALYDTNKCVDILMERDGMDEDEAIEFFEFNVAGAYVGEHTPMFVDPYHQSWLEYNEGDIDFYSDWSGEE
jgi:hypothetical protein